MLPVFAWSHGMVWGGRTSRFIQSLEKGPLPQPGVLRALSFPGILPRWELVPKMWRNCSILGFLRCKWGLWDRSSPG